MRVSTGGTPEPSSPGTESRLFHTLAITRPLSASVSSSVKKEGPEFPLAEVTFGVTVPKRSQNPENSGYNYCCSKTGKNSLSCASSHSSPSLPPPPPFSGGGERARQRRVKQEWDGFFDHTLERRGPSPLPEEPTPANPIPQ